MHSSETRSFPVLFSSFPFYYIRYSEISNPRPGCQEATVACLSQLSLTHAHMQANALIYMHTQIPVYSCIYPTSPTEKQIQQHTRRDLCISALLSLGNRLYLFICYYFLCSRCLLAIRSNSVSIFCKPPSSPAYCTFTPSYA